MAYVALRRIRFGDGFLLPGDPVPDEEGRNYQAAVAIGDIADVDTVEALQAELDRLRAERDEVAGTPVPVPSDPFVVYAYATVDGELVCHAYGPTDQASAEALVPEIAQRVTGVECMVLPLEPVPTFGDGTEDATEDQLDGLSRAELDKLAEDAGVENPAKLPNKGAVIDAIRAAKSDEASQGSES